MRALMAGVVPEEILFPFPEIPPEERETVSAFLESLRGFAREPFVTLRAVFGARRALKSLAALA